MLRHRLRAAITRTYRRMGVRFHFVRCPRPANDCGHDPYGDCGVPGAF